MFKTTVIPQSRDLHLTIPVSMIGKEIEIIIYRKKIISVKKHTKKFEDIMKFYSQYNFQTSQITFTRDELHER
jgi:dihydroorotase